MKATLQITVALLVIFANTAFAKIVHIKIDGGISPGTSLFVENSIKYAESTNAEAMIITLNTPGGLLDATRDIVQNIMASKVPIAVYIAPGGARAGSAGVFITLAANIAAMAPGTNIGAAHPVDMGGNAPDSIMGDKITNDAAAFIRSIANERNRNIDWAERTVRESISATEKEALLAGAIDYIAPNLNALVKYMDGCTVSVADGEVTIKSAGVAIENREMDWREYFLFWISNPNIAYILLMIGIYGLIFEFWSPGAIFPGVIGGISLLLSLFSLQMLPVNLVGAALILLSIIMFLLEIKVVSYGLLTIGGVISLAIGSIILIDAPNKVMDISMNLIITFVILTALFFAAIGGIGLRAQFKKKATGQSALLGLKGNALDNFSSGAKGQVRVFGEIWSAVSEDNISVGDEIIVEQVNEFLLKVRKYTGS